MPWCGARRPSAEGAEQEGAARPCPEGARGASGARGSTLARSLLWQGQVQGMLCLILGVWLEGGGVAVSWNGWAWSGEGVVGVGVARAPANSRGSSSNCIQQSLGSPRPVTGLWQAKCD